MSKVIKMRVTSSDLSIITPNAKIICGNEEQWAIEFEFDEAWDSHDKKVARFIYNGHYENVDFTGNTCAVPVLSNTTNVTVGVYSKEGKKLATDSVVIPCELSILCTGAKKGATPYINGDSCFIRYSAYPDGTDFTEDLRNGQSYIGIATGQSAPTDKSGYEWAMFNRTDHEKRITNLEKGYNDDLFMTFETTNKLGDYVAVPSNALPYAEINTINNGGVIESYALIPSKNSADVYVETEGIPDTLTVEKIAEGTFRFNGYTEFQGNNIVKFATINLPNNVVLEGGDISYTIVSNETTTTERPMFYVSNRGYTDDVRITESGERFITVTETNDLLVDIGTSYNGVVNLVVKFEVEDGTFTGERIDLFEAPYLNNSENSYIDYEKGVLVNRGTGEETDVREQIGYDNFIKVTAGGELSFSAQTKITFMLKGAN